ncbi:MAG: phage tail protein I [Synergistaceae bacterium]|nr:phage tail protein I [Synergistaceae bacterium]
MNDIYTLSLADISPPNLTADSHVNAIIHALDPELQAVSRDALLPVIFARIDELDEHTTDLLAWQLHCDFYDLAATLTMKHEAVKSSLKWHMKKGTAWAIVEALKSLGVDATFIPWWQSDDEPYTFRIDAKITGDYYRTAGRDKINALIRRAVNESKSARSLLKELKASISFTENLPLHAGLASALTGHQSIGLILPEKSYSPNFYVAIPHAWQGNVQIPIEKAHDLTTPIFSGVVQASKWDVDLGVDLDTMQELLLRFEQRIFDRIDAHEKFILDEFNKTQKELNLQLEEIKDLLRWAPPDDPL